MSKSNNSYLIFLIFLSILLIFGYIIYNKNIKENFEVNKCNNMDDCKTKNCISKWVDGSGNCLTKKTDKNTKCKLGVDSNGFCIVKGTGKCKSGYVDSNGFCGYIPSAIAVS